MLARTPNHVEPHGPVVGIEAVSAIHEPKRTVIQMRRSLELTLPLAVVTTSPPKQVIPPEAQGFITNKAQLLEVCHDIVSASTDSASSVLQKYEGYLEDGDEAVMAGILRQDCDVKSMVTNKAGDQHAIFFGPATSSDQCDVEIAFDARYASIPPIELIKTSESELIEICSKFYRQHSFLIAENGGDFETFEQLSEGGCVFSDMSRVVRGNRDEIVVQFSTAPQNLDCNDYFLPLVAPLDAGIQGFDSRYEIQFEGAERDTE